MNTKGSPRSNGENERVNWQEEIREMIIERVRGGEEEIACRCKRIEERNEEFKDF